MTFSKKILLPVIIGLTLFGGGFWTGTYYQKNKVSNNLPPEFPDMSSGQSTNADRGSRPSGANGQGGPGGGASGEIISATDSSITVKKNDGSTVIVYFDSSLQVVKNQTIDKSVLTVGTKVQVMGSTNSDNSVTGKSIMIQPE